LVSGIDIRTDGVLELDHEKNIWTQKGEMVGDWRKLHNKELRNLYSSPQMNRMEASKVEIGRNCSSNVKVDVIVEIPNSKIKKKSTEKT
jgi:hypothetical protein